MQPSSETVKWVDGSIKGREKFYNLLKKIFGKNSLEGVRGGNAVGGDGDLCAGGRAPTQEGEWGGGLQRDQTRLAPATFGPVDLVFFNRCVYCF